MNSMLGSTSTSRSLSVGAALVVSMTSPLDFLRDNKDLLFSWSPAVERRSNERILPLGAGTNSNVHTRIFSDDVSELIRHWSSAATLVQQVNLRAVAQSASIEQWRSRVLETELPSDVDSLSVTIEAVLTCVSEYGLDAIALDGFAEDTVQPEHFAAMLRAVSTWRDRLPGWSNALRLAERAGARAGLDVEDLLFGMRA